MIVDIGNPDGIQASVSSRGGTITKFSWKGIDVFFPQIPIGSKLRGGSHVCFPFFGPAKGRFASNIPQHGWMRDEELILSPPVLGSKVWFTSGKNASQNNFLWLLRHLTLGVEVWDNCNKLEMDFNVCLDARAGTLPVNPAFHPYFANLGKREVRVGDRVITEFNDEIIPVPADGKILLDLGYLRVNMVLGGDFGKEACLCLWSDDKRYFCVEPIMTHPDKFDTPEGKFLGPGKELEFVCSLEVIET